jgi:diadenosine tetraphosphate (Ap4A) HIT family hydrolase
MTGLAPGFAQGSSMISPSGQPAGSCPLCNGADPGVNSPLQQLLPAGQSRFIARSPRLVSIPTLGCFTPGYILIVPVAHATSFGRLDKETLAEADEMIGALAARIMRVYGIPALGFEYGSNVPGSRRIEHAHWHLLPSRANLSGWLASRMRGQAITSLTDLPRSPHSSYIAIRDQAGALTSYPQDTWPGERPRLRRVVADLDPRIDAAGWDWASHGYADLIRRTAADLAPAPAGGTRT